MPAFQGKIREEDADLLAKFLRSFSGSSASEAAIETANDFDQRFENLMNELDNLKRRYYSLPQPTSRATEDPMN